MRNLLRAEWQKVSGNRPVVASLIWIFPASAIAVTAFALVLALLSADFRAGLQTSPLTWTDTVMEAWAIINTVLGQFAIVSFTAIMFAGEYQWGMWKNLMPRRGRMSLIVSKFLVLTVFIVLSFIAFTIFAGIGGGLVSAATGASYGPALSGEVIGDFTQQYGVEALVSLGATLLAAGYAALAAIYTGNVLASVIIGILITVAETGILLPLILFAQLLNNQDVLLVYFFTPSYNLGNIRSSVLTGEPYTFMERAPFSLEASLLIVTVWIVALISLAVWLFRRRDVMA